MQVVAHCAVFQRTTKQESIGSNFARKIIVYVLLIDDAKSLRDNIKTETF